MDRRDDRESRYNRNRDDRGSRRSYSSSQERGAAGNRRRTPSQSPKRDRRTSPDVKLEKHMSSQNEAPRREDPEQNNGVVAAADTNERRE